MPVVGIEGVGEFKGCHPLLVIPLALRHEARHLQIAREEMVQCKRSKYMGIIWRSNLNGQLDGTFGIRHGLLIIHVFPEESRHGKVCTTTLNGIPYRL